MKKTYEDFLQLLKASINKSEVKINNVNWQSILQLSNIHKVLPLVYEALYKSEEFNKKGLKSLYSKASYLGSYIQSPMREYLEMRIY